MNNLIIIIIIIMIINSYKRISGRPPAGGKIDARTRFTVVHVPVGSEGMQKLIV